MTKGFCYGRALPLDLSTVRPCIFPSAAGANTRGGDTSRVAVARAVVVR